VFGVRAEGSDTGYNSEHDAAWQNLPASGLFDHIFVRTPNCVETVVANGWADRKNCTILMSAFEPTVHRSIPGVEKDIDVLFVGSMNHRRECMVTEASRHCRITVASVYRSEMVKLLNRAKIVLNMHVSSVLDTETRVYEALGCGSFLLTERLSPENPFSESDLAVFDSTDEMVEKVQYYLEHEEEREAIAYHGHRTALEGHTYAERAQQVLGVMAGYLIPGCSAVPMVRRDADFVRCALSEYEARLKRLGWVLRQRLVLGTETKGMSHGDGRET
jgi:spore maturation protein CgeB